MAIYTISYGLQEFEPVSLKPVQTMGAGQRVSPEKKMPSVFEKNIRKKNRFLLCGLLFRGHFSFEKNGANFRDS